MKDKILNLTDIPEIEVKEDKHHNLILHFKKDFIYKKGDILKIWSSKIAEQARQEAVEVFAREILRSARRIITQALKKIKGGGE